MTSQSNARTAKLFFDYPALWPHAYRVIQNRNGATPRLHIRVTRATFDIFDFTLRWSEGPRCVYYGDDSPEHVGLVAKVADTVLAVGRRHNVLATIVGATGIVGETVHDVFAGIKPDDVDHLLLIFRSDWYRPAAEEEGVETTSEPTYIHTELDVLVIKPPSNMSWSELCVKYDAELVERARRMFLPPHELIDLTAIEDALRCGAKLEIFSVSTHIRQVRVTMQGRMIAHAFAEELVEALRRANIDLLDGGHRYSTMYGAGGYYPSPTVGHSYPSSRLDLHVLNGGTIAARGTNTGKNIVAAVTGYEPVQVPETLLQQLFAGEAVSWKERGYTFKAECRPGSSPEQGVIDINLVACERGSLEQFAFEVLAERTATAPTLWEAVLAAIDAKREFVEVS